MTWKIPEHKRKHVRYSRNTLRLVVAELRFFPLPKLPEVVEEFHSLVSSEFPDFRPGLNRNLNIDTDAREVQFTEEQQWMFRDREGFMTALLRTGSLVLETRAHVDRKHFASKFRFVLEQLTSLRKPITRRLGLRYINDIKLHEIEAALNAEQLSWSDLIHESFLKVPGGLSDLENTQLSGEVRSTMDTGGLTLKWSINDSIDQFSLDMDRFVEKELEAAEVPTLLQDFAQDLFSLFDVVAQESLWKWMKGE